MDYDPDEFLELESAVEALGGLPLPEVCSGHTIKYPASRGKAHQRIQTAHCNNHSKFSVPYLGENDKLRHVVACAVDDNMGAWPRLTSA